MKTTALIIKQPKSTQISIKDWPIFATKLRHTHFMLQIRPWLLQPNTKHSSRTHWVLFHWIVKFLTTTLFLPPTTDRLNLLHSTNTTVSRYNIRRNLLLLRRLLNRRRRSHFWKIKTESLYREKEKWMLSVVQKSHLKATGTTDCLEWERERVGLEWDFGVLFFFFGF